MKYRRGNLGTFTLEPASPFGRSVPGCSHRASRPQEPAKGLRGPTGHIFSIRRSPETSPPEVQSAGQCPTSHANPCSFPGSLRLYPVLSQRPPGSPGHCPNPRVFKATPFPSTGGRKKRYRPGSPDVRDKNTRYKVSNFSLSPRNRTKGFHYLFLG